MVTKFMAPKKKGNLAHTKKAPSEIRATDSQAARTAIYLLPLYAVYMNRDCYVAIRTNGRLDFLTKKRKQNPLPKGDASSAEATPGRVQKDERGEARLAITTPNCGPHLELGH